MELYPTVLVGFATLFAITAALFFHGKWANRGKKKEPPQAKGAWPVIGHLHLLGGSRPPHHILADMADKHGPIFTIKLGVHNALVVSDPQIAKDCLTTNDKAFASRPRSESAKLMAYDYAMFGLAPYGDYWRQVRKITIQKFLSQRRVEMLGHIRVSEVGASVKDLFDAWVENKERGNVREKVKVDMARWFGDVLVNIVVRAITGRRFSSSDEEGVHFQVVVRRFIELATAFVVSDFIPFLKCLDVGGYRKEMKKTAQDLDDIFEEWLRLERESGEGKGKGEGEGEGKQGFISELISVLEDASAEEFCSYEEDTIIKATCQQILTAGLDTTTATLTCALSLLLNSPKALKRAQDEIDEHVGKDKLVKESDIKNLVYLDAIIKETLRLYPPGPLSVPHESMEDCVVGGFTIPKGTRLFVNLWKMHRDPNIWSDPCEFQPERFLTTHKDIDLKGKHFELLPFASGRRICPGTSYALYAMSFILARLLQQFMLQKPSDEPIDMSSNKETSLEVLLSPRLSFNMY